MKIKHFSIHFTEEASWGEKEVIKFRWVLITAILLLIVNMAMSGYPDRALISAYPAILYFLYNAGLNFIIKRFPNFEWLGYISSFIDVTTLSIHLYLYAYFFEPSAVISAASILIYCIIILLSVLRYDGTLVIFTTVYTILAYNLIYLLLRPHIDINLLSQADLYGWPSMFYRSVYFGLMAFYLFSIPKLLERLMVKQVKAIEENNEIELKLAIEQHQKDVALTHLEKERFLYEQLTEQKLMIENQNLKLQELVATKDKLFSIIGHDLRTPFSIQSSIGDLLLADFDKHPKDYLKECVTTMRDSSLNGIMLLSNLLEWAKAQNDYSTYNPKSFNVDVVVSDVLLLMGDTYALKKIEVHKNFGEDITAYGDIQMVKTVLRNLLSNSIKFTSFGGRVDIYAELTQNGTLIAIKDNGVGIRKDKLTKLFMVDMDISTMGTNSETGSGLGLVLCKDLVEKHNGRIWVESNGKKGSEFFIELPFAQKI